MRRRQCPQQADPARIRPVLGVAEAAQTAAPQRALVADMQQQRASGQPAPSQPRRQRRARGGIDDQPRLQRPARLQCRPGISPCRWCPARELRPAIQPVFGADVVLPVQPDRVGGGDPGAIQQRGQLVQRELVGHVDRPARTRAQRRHRTPLRGIAPVRSLAAVQRDHCADIRMAGVHRCAPCTRGQHVAGRAVASVQQAEQAGQQDHVAERAKAHDKRARGRRRSGGGHRQPRGQPRRTRLCPVIAAGGGRSISASTVGARSHSAPGVSVALRPT